VWKKKENEAPAPTPVSEPEPRPKPSRPAAPAPRTERAVIGPTVRIKGEISGEEDLVVQGKIEGKIEVKGRGVTVGKAGKVSANIYARTIRVEGSVRGDLFGEQEIVIEAEGDVEGNLVAPSVRLENGSRFKGSIDMERSTPPIPATIPSPQAPQKTDGSQVADMGSKQTVPSPTPRSGQIRS
jgi:cytoskeletal protein CcmA (bactofilin family)